MRLTLIVVRRMVATPKTAGAGVMLEASFPMFTKPMATSSERIAPSRLFGCLDFSVMVETQGSGFWAKVVRKIPNTDKKTSVHLGAAHLVQLYPFGGKVVMIELAITAFEDAPADRCARPSPPKSVTAIDNPATFFETRGAREHSLPGRLFMHHV